MIESGFFPSKGGDRPYSAEQFGKIMDFLITDGVYEVYPESGVLYDENGRENTAYMPFKVTFITSRDAYYSPTNPSVVVGPGRAWFDHTWTHVSSPEIVPMPSDPNSGERWDILCLTMDKSDAMRRNYFEWVLGNIGEANPPLSKLTGHYMHGDQVHQVPIAFVKRRYGGNGVPVQIRSAVGYALCPFVRSINGSRNNVWSVQHIIDAASARIDERIANMNVEIDEWLEKKSQEVDEYLRSIQGAITNEVLLEVDDRYNELDKVLDQRIQGQVTQRMEGIEDEIRQKADQIIDDKIDGLDIKSMVDDAISTDVLERLDTIENNITQEQQNTLDKAHPIGSYYWSDSETEPSSLFGGVWTKVQNTFIYCRGSSQSAGTTGGQSSMTLSTSHMPAHSHTLSNGSHSHTYTLINHSHTLGSHTHTMNHNHHLNVESDGGQMLGINMRTSAYVSGAWNNGGLASGQAFNTFGCYALRVKAYEGKTGAATGNTGSTGGSGTSASTNTVSITCNSAGSGSSFSLMPPYRATNCWRRTA